MRILGIDIGGTHIKYMLVKDGKRIEVGEIRSEAKKGAKVLLKNVYKVCDKYKFDLLGVSTAGMVGKHGEISYANDNIPNYTGTKLKEILEKKYKAKVAVLNDIYASSLSELSKTFKDYYFIAIGTGISGALVQNGKIYMGDKMFAGQFAYLPSRDGKSVIDKTCSITGLESYSKYTAKEIFAEIEKGNKVAIKAMDKWCHDLMYLFTMIVGFFNPKHIVISGGITQQGKKLSDYITKFMYLLPEPYQNTFDIVIAKEQKYAGVVGAIKNVIKKYAEDF